MSNQNIDDLLIRAGNLEKRGDRTEAIALYESIANQAAGTQEATYALNSAERLRGFDKLAEVALEQGIYRQDTLLLVGNGADLPFYCVKCNAPCTDPQKLVTFHWVSLPARIFFSFAVLAAFVIEGWFLRIRLPVSLATITFVVLANIITTKAKHRVSFCREHSAQRKFRRILGASIGAIACFAIAFIAHGVLVGQVPSPVLALVFTPVGAIIGLSFAPDVIKANQIDSRFTRIDGICFDYLARFPAQQNNKLPADGHSAN